MSEHRLANLSVGEVRDPASRFPRIYLAIDGKRYLFALADASRFGKAVAEADRRSVARVDIGELREIICEVEVTPCDP